MAIRRVSAHEMISETAKSEGGSGKRSESAEMQSQVAKERNFEQAAQDVVGKMEKDPESVTSEDATYLKSREAKVTGQAQPPRDSISAEAQRQAAVNEGATKSAQATGTQSTTDHKENFEQLAADVGSKIQNDPESVTKEEANMLHNREQRAFGETSNGGITSQAHSVVSINGKKGAI